MALIQRMGINIILFGEEGVGKSSVINLLAGKDVARTSADAYTCTSESTRYMLSVAGRTFNIWDTTGLGEPSFTGSNHLSDIEKMYVLIKQIGEQGGLDLLLFCISGRSRITQNMLLNYRLFFEVLCEKRIPIAVVVTRLEDEKNSMEEWWLRNREHVSRCGLQFSGHACVTGLLWHPKAAEGQAALGSLLLGCDPGENYGTFPPSDWLSGFLERLSVISGPETSKDKRYKPKELERLLRDRCMMNSADARRLAGYLVRPNESTAYSVIATRPTRNPTQSLSSHRSASSPLRNWIVTPLRHPLILGSTNWLKTILGSAFLLHDDDIVVFLIGPSGSGKSTFVHTVTQTRNLVGVGPTLRSSTRKVQAIRCELTDEGRIALRAGERTNIVFVDTPSLFADLGEDMGAVKELSAWLKKSKSKSTCFGTIYLHRIGVDPDMDSLHRVQTQLDTFAGTFPVNVITQAFPQRLHCVFSCMDEIRKERIVDHQEKFQNQLSKLRPRVVNGWKPKWKTSIHPDLFIRDNPDTAWAAVEALFSSPSYSI